MSSPTALRSPALPSAPTSPLLSRKENSSHPAVAWAPRRPTTNESVSQAVGAEGGTGAIGLKRRESNSFKTMTTGSLVSNSPFARRLGTVAPPHPPVPKAPQTTRAPPPNTPSAAASSSSSLYSASRIPISRSSSSLNDRKPSGSRSASVDESLPKENRQVSGEHDEHSSLPSLQLSSSDKPGSTHSSTRLPLSLATSPSVPFRPVRAPVHQAPTSLPTSTRFIPTCPAPSPHNPQGSTSHLDSASAPAPKSELVSSSLPSKRHPLPPTPAASTSTASSSSPLGHVPYEIPPLAKEGAPFNVYSLDRDYYGSGDDDDDDPPCAPAQPFKPAASGMGLGICSGAPPTTTGERRIAGSSIPPPATPPHDRSRAASASPTSALSPTRRGIKGPRAFKEQDGDDTETEEDEVRRVVRRQASTKTVTWAETEEVLEFDVEEDRRRSMASDVTRSTNSSDGDASFDTEDGDVSLPFEEGGSVEVHEIDESFESDSAASTIDDMIDEVTSFMTDDIFGGSFDDQSAYSDRTTRSYPMAPGSSFSASTVSNGSSTGDDAEDATSESSYDEEEEVVQAAKVHSALDAAQVAFDLRSPLLPTSLPLLPLHSSSSAYSLPDLPENSPFMGFDDDGAASSVVSIDLNKPGRPMVPLSSPPRTSKESLQALSGPMPSTPTSARASTAGVDFDSPILSAFAFTETISAPRLSREASIVDSDASGTYKASLRGVGRLAASQERLDETLRRNQARLEGCASPLETDISVISPDLGRFPDPPRQQLVPPPTSVAIAARPALKTASSSSTFGGLPTIAGSPSAKLLGVGMESPLDRLSREVIVSGEGEMEIQGLKPSTSNGSLASHTSATSIREAEIIVRKRSVQEQARPRPRRSLSTGDVAEAASIRGSHGMLKGSTLPEFSPYGLGLDPIAVGAGPTFALGIESSLDDIYRQRNSSYRIRESKLVVYANDGEVATVGAAGDVDPGRAWRKKRPSDMNLPSLTSSRSVSASSKSKGHERPCGQVYVKLVEFVFDKAAFPVPAARTIVDVFVKNSAKATSVGNFSLNTVVSIGKEFELTSLNPLEVSVHIPISQRTNPHLLPPPPPPPPSAPPKSPSRLRSVFSSPKKKPPVVNSPRPPVPDRLLQFIGPDGVFARTKVAIGSYTAQSRGKVVRLALPIATDPNSSQKAATGSLIVELLWVPPLGAVPSLPKSMAEVQSGLAAAEAETRLALEGVLTQLGGDCTTWRRRLFKLLGPRLIPYSEVAKRAFVELDLSVASSIFDPATPAPANPSTGLSKSASADFEEERYTGHDHAFTLLFKDGSEIAFFADTEADKVRWLDALGSTIGRKAGRKAPEWAVKLKRTLDAPAVAATK